MKAENEIIEEAANEFRCLTELGSISYYTGMKAAFEVFKKNCVDIYKPIGDGMNFIKKDPIAEKLAEIKKLIGNPPSPCNKYDEAKDRKAIRLLSDIIELIRSEKNETCIL